MPTRDNAFKKSKVAKAKHFASELPPSQQELNLQTIIDSSNDAMVVIQDGKFLFWNRKVYDLFGFTEDDMHRLAVKDVLPPRMMKQFMQRMQDRMNNVASDTLFEMPLVAKDGSEIMVEVAATVVSVNNKPAIQYIARDLSSEKRVIQELKYSEENLRRLADNIDAGLLIYNHTADKVTYYNECLKNLFHLENLEATNISAFLGSFLSLATVSSILDSFLSLLEEKSIAGLTNQFQYEQPHHATIQIEYKIFPLAHNTNNEALYAFWFQDITQRIKDREALEQSLAHYRLLVEKAFDAIYLLRNGHFDYVNPRFCQITGYTTDELTRNDFHMNQLLTPAAIQIVDQRMQSRQQGLDIPDIYEIQIINKQKKILDVELSTSKLNDPNDIVVLGIMRDISDRKRAEESLLFSEEFNRAIVQNSPLGISVRDANGNLLTVNKAWKSIWRSTDLYVFELQRRKRPKLIFDSSDSYLDPHQEQIEDIYKNGGSLHIPEIRVEFPRDNRVMWISHYFYAIKGRDGAVNRVVILTEDITKRKLAELSLKKSEEEYRSLIESFPHAIIIHQDHKLVYANQAVMQMFNYDSTDSILGTSALEHVSEKDLPRITEYIEKRIKGDKNIPNHYQMLMRKSSGEEFSVEVFINPTVFNGRPAFLGILIDISKLDQAERAIRETEQKLNQFINNIDEIVYYLDISGNKFILNNAFEKITGYSIASPESLNELWNSLIHPEDLAAFKFIDTKDEVGAQEIEYRIIHVHGHWKWLRSKRVPVNNLQGEVTGFYCIDADITEQKLFMEYLQENEAKSRFESHVRTILNKLASDLIETREIPTSLKLLSAAIIEAKLFRRVICTIYDDSYKIVVSEGAGIPEEQIKARLNQPSMTTTLKDKLENISTKLSRSYFIPFERRKEEQFLDDDINGSIPSRASIDDFIDWHPKDMLFVQLRNHKGDFLGLLSVDDPFDGKRPTLESIGNLELFADHIELTIQRIIEAQELKRSEERFRHLFENANDAIIVCSTNGQIYTCNQKATKYFLYTKDELFDKTINQLISDKSNTPANFLNLAVNSKSTLLFETAGHRKDSSIFPIEASISSINWGEQEALLIFIRDVSLRKQQEDEKRKLEQQIQHEQKLKSIGILAGGIAHDFNNLLVAILGNASLSLEDINPQHPLYDSIKQIESAAIKASDLTKQLLAYSGKGSISIKSVNINQVVTEMMDLLKISINKQVKFIPKLDESLPYVHADSSQIQQIVMNLIINASEAIDNESGTITMETGSMHCDAHFLEATYIDDNLASGEFVYLSVTDSGCGMDKDTIASIFDPFFTTKFTGRGLGLAAVLGIVRSHKGAILVESEINKGSTFTVYFPKATDTETLSTGETKVPQDWKGTGEIIIIDDDTTVLLVAQKVLAKHGFNPKTFNNGWDGIYYFQKHQKDVQLILLDLTMPNISGLDTFKHLREHNPNIKVLLLSGFNEIEAEEQFQGQTFTGFIPKPFKPDLLIQKIFEALS